MHKRGLIFTLLMTTVFCLQGFAQEEDKPEEIEVTRYTVYFSNFAEQEAIAGTDFETKGEADKAAESMRSLRDLDGKKLYFNVEVRPEKFVQTVTRPSRAKTRPATGLEGSPITKPVLTFVDPGSLTKRAAKVPSLAGKKGTGTIGKSKVTIEFTGEGEKGEFVISGDLEGKGKWVQLGPFVQLETGMAKFDGKLDGDKLGGNRKMKEGGEKDEWSIKLGNVQVPNVKVVEGTVGIKKNALAGTTWKTSNGHRLEFRADGTLIFNMEGKGKWTLTETSFTGDTVFKNVIHFKREFKGSYSNGQITMSFRTIDFKQTDGEDVKSATDWKDWGGWKQVQD